MFGVLYGERFGSEMNMEQTECSETSAYKIQTPGNHSNESIQHSGHGKSLKSRLLLPKYIQKFRNSLEEMWLNA
jgi:hypothetical protein